MPRLRNARASSFEMSSSSSGARRGSASSRVTSAPNDRYSDANSSPTAPAPMTTAEDGMRVVAQRLVARDAPASPTGARAAAAAREPVASTTSRRLDRARRPPRRAGPRRAWRCPGSRRSPLACSSPVTPVTSLSTMPSWNAWIAGQSGSPAALMPHSRRARRCRITSADCRSAFVGMHPRSRHVPPSRSSRSTMATRLPSCAARSAAE